MIIKPSDRKDQFIKLKKGINKKGLTTGFLALDDYVRLAKSYLMIVTGYPGSGKSEWLDAILLNMCLLHGWKTVYYSPENHPVEQHMSKIAEKYIGKHIVNFSTDDLEKSLVFLEENYTWLYPEEPELDILLSGAHSLKQEGKLDCFVIDPWNSITHKRSGNMIHEYLAEALTRLIKFGRNQEVLMSVVAHPTKPQKDKDGNYSPLNLYDISDGAMWRNRCDYGIIINRPDMSKNQVKVTVGKIKNKWMGKLGEASLDYDFVTGRFKNTSDPDFTLPNETPPPF